MIKDKKTAIVGGVVGILMLVTIFCCNGKNETQESNTQPTVDDETSQNVELSPFEDTFRSNRDLYGAGYIFEWNGQEYTTDWKEELNN